MQRCIREATYRANRALTLLLNQAHFQIGVSAADERLICELGDRAAVRSIDLAARLEVERSTIGRLVHPLADYGILVLGRDPSDRRARTVELTGFGRHVHGMLWSYRATVDDLMASGWKDGEAADLVARLEQVRRRALTELAKFGARPRWTSI